MSRVLAVDWGTKRLGLAVSDPTGMLARGLPTLAVRSPEQAVTSVAETARAEDVPTILMGLPLNMDGSEGASAKGARRMGQALRRQGFTVLYRDERLTSEDALDHLRRGGDTRPRKERVDQVAALLLLQGYLDTRTAEKGCA